MLRLSKMTDYAVVIMAHLARSPGRMASSAELADETSLQPATVAKLLRQLQQAGLLASQRGVAGGYGLGRAANAISVAEIVEAIEGPVALTTCIEGHQTVSCAIEHCCPLGGGWSRINDAIKTALEAVSLAEMAGPLPAWANAGRPFVEADA
jgi:FeS assembly SUF system regulator